MQFTLSFQNTILFLIIERTKQSIHSHSLSISVRLPLPGQRGNTQGFSPKVLFVAPKTNILGGNLSKRVVNVNGNFQPKKTIQAIAKRIFENLKKPVLNCNDISNKNTTLLQGHGTRIGARVLVLSVDLKVIYLSTPTFKYQHLNLSMEIYLNSPAQFSFLSVLRQFVL